MCMSWYWPGSGATLTRHGSLFAYKLSLVRIERCGPGGASVISSCVRVLLAVCLCRHCKDSSKKASAYSKVTLLKLKAKLGVTMQPRMLIVLFPEMFVNRTMWNELGQKYNSLMGDLGHVHLKTFSPRMTPFLAAFSDHVHIHGNDNEHWLHINNYWSSW